MQDNKKDNQGSEGPWWREAAFLFSEISAWIVVPIVAALIVGKTLDQKYDTAPWLFIILAALGFLVTAYGIIHSVKKYTKTARIKKEDWKRLKRVKEEEDGSTEEKTKSI